MLAANVWTWWIGIAFSLVVLLLTVALVAGYVKTVSSKRYPSAKQRRAQRTDL